GSPNGVQSVVPERRALFERLVEISRAGIAPASLTEGEVPDYVAEVRLLERCGSQLAPVLRGQLDPRDVLLTEPWLGLVRCMYRDSPPSRVYNTLSAQTIAALAARSDRPLRLLEVGGGTGGTTSYVLPNDAVEYVFTDISPLFVERAKAEFPGITA